MANAERPGLLPTSPMPALPAPDPSACLTEIPVGLSRDTLPENGFRTRQLILSIDGGGNDGATNTYSAHVDAGAVLRNQYNLNVGTPYAVVGTMLQEVGVTRLRDGDNTLAIVTY